MKIYNLGHYTKEIIMTALKQAISNEENPVERKKIQEALETFKYFSETDNSGWDNLPDNFK